MRFIAPSPRQFLRGTREYGDYYVPFPPPHPCEIFIDRPCMPHLCVVRKKILFTAAVPRSAERHDSLRCREPSGYLRPTVLPTSYMNRPLWPSLMIHQWSANGPRWTIVFVTLARRDFHLRVRKRGCRSLGGGRNPARSSAVYEVSSSTPLRNDRNRCEGEILFGILIGKSDEIQLYTNTNKCLSRCLFVSPDLSVISHDTSVLSQSYNSYR